MDVKQQRMWLHADKLYTMITSLVHQKRSETLNSQKENIITQIVLVDFVLTLVDEIMLGRMRKKRCKHLINRSIMKPSRNC